MKEKGTLRKKVYVNPDRTPKEREEHEKLELNLKKDKKQTQILSFLGGKLLQKENIFLTGMNAV